MVVFSVQLVFRDGPKHRHEPPTSQRSRGQRGVGRGAWARASTLILSPAFRRRSLWPADPKSYLIDTIIRGVPLPADDQRAADVWDSIIGPKVQ